jgi:hypothetical protein
MKEIENIGQAKTLGWTKYQDGKHEKVYYRQEKGTTLHTTYTETVIKAPIVDVAMVLSDVNAYK